MNNRTQTIPPGPLEHTYRLTSGIELWIESCAYFPALVIKKPKTLTHSRTALHYHTMEPYQEIITDEQNVFLDDLLANYLGDPNVPNNDKLHAMRKLREFAARLESAVQERIEDEQADAEQADEYARWIDLTPSDLRLGARCPACHKGLIIEANLRHGRDGEGDPYYHCTQYPACSLFV